MKPRSSFLIVKKRIYPKIMTLNYIYTHESSDFYSYYHQEVSAYENGHVNDFITIH